MRLAVWGWCLLFLVACSPVRDEDAAATEPGQPLDATGAEVDPCACPPEEADPGQACDVAMMQARFSSCPSPHEEPCATIELGCNDVPTNVAALDCVLDQLADGNAIRYSVNRASCPGEDAYAIVVSSSGGVGLGLECYGTQSGLVPFDSAFMDATHFAECQDQSDALTRYTCLEAGLGFAEGNAARCQ